MSKCRDVLVEMEERGESRETIDYVALQAAVIRNKKTGRYADPAKKIPSFAQMLAEKAAKPFKDKIGQHITVQNLTNNSFDHVEIVDVIPVSRTEVKINGTTYSTVDGLSSAGDKEIEIFGSEATTGVNGFGINESFKIMNADSLYDVLVKVDEEDLADETNRASDEHIDYLADIFDLYAEQMDKATDEIDITVDVMQNIIKSEVGPIRGTSNPNTGKIKLLKGDRKWASGVEILAHEVQHVMIEGALKSPGSEALKRDIRNLMEAMEKQLDHTIFLRRFPKREDKDGNLVHTSEEIQRAKQLFQYTFNHADHPVSEFLAYATTNEDMVHALGGLTVKGEILKLSESTNRLAKLYNKIASKVNKIYNRLKYGNKDGKQLALQYFKKALELRDKSIRNDETGVFSNVATMLHDGNTKVKEMTTRMEREEKSLKEDLRDEVNKKVTKFDKAIARMWRIRGLSEAKSWALQNKLFSGLLINHTGEKIGEFYDLIRQSKTAINKTAYNMKQVMYGTLLEDYGLKKMDEGLRRASKRVLIDTDSRGIGSLEDVKKVIENDEEFLKMLVEAKAGLNKDTIRFAESLGVLVATNEMGIQNGYSNATQIARDVQKNTSDIIISKIDKVASLTALQAISQEDKQLFLKAFEENPDGLRAATNMYYSHQDKLLEVAYSGDRWMIDKGAKQDFYVNDRKYYIVTEEEMSSLVHKTKMENTGKHEDLSRIMGQDMYIVVGDSLETAYAEGLMSTVQLKSEGDSLKRILADSGLFTAEEIEAKIREESGAKPNSSGNYLIPDRRYDGAVKDYRLRISQDIKEQYLGLENGIVHTVSHTVANLTHKDEAVISNKNAVKYLTNFYKRHKNDKDMNFVKIGPDSEGKNKEYWDIMPSYLKVELKRLQGTDALFIEESMLVDFFGFKEASFSNLFNNKRFKLGILKVEKVMREIAQRWAGTIVTRTGSTIMGNAQSNMLVTMQHTGNLNPVKYGQEFVEMWEAMNTYQRDSREVQRLEVLKSAGENISQQRIDSLKARMKDSAIAPILEDGQYNAILEDLDVISNENEGILKRKIDDMFKKIKGKDKREDVKAIFDTLFLNEESKLYGKIKKATLYPDALNRAIIHRHNMQKGEMSERESLRYVDSLFVNYTYLDNKYIKYMNDLMFVKFTKYFFRSIYAMAKMSVKLPLTMFLTETTEAMTGVDLESPTDQMYNPIDTLMNKVFIWGEPGNVLETVLEPTIFKPLP